MSQAKVATQTSSAARTQSRPPAPQSGRAAGPPEAEHPVLQLQRAVGNRRVAAGLPRGTAAAELPRGVAEPLPLILQRKCACGSAPAGSCEGCNGKSALQRKAEGTQATRIPPSVNRVLRRPGHPMDRDTRGFMESRFGRDFGGVRLHTDAEAARSAREIEAQAYTVGNQIVFGDGHYRPKTAKGQHLLAHELAHTVQQQGLQARSEAPLDVTSPGQALERQADQAANAALRGGPMPALGGASAPVVAMAPETSTGSDEKVPAPSTEGNEWRELPANDQRRKRGITAEAGPSTSLPGAKGGGSVMAFRVGAFRVPNAKGGKKARGAYQRALNAGALRATIAISGNEAHAADLSQGRANTPELRANWLRKVGWTEATAANNWSLLVGGNKQEGKQRFVPKVGDQTCDMDHVLELQVMGTNVDKNVQVLDPGPNRASGSKIASFLRELAQAAYNGIASDAKPNSVILHFTSVVPDDDPEPVCGGCPPEGQPATSCCQVEQCATSPEGRKRTNSNASDTAETAGPEGTTPFEIKAGGASATLHALPAGSDTDLLKSGPANATAAELIPGVLLGTLHRTSDKGGTLRGKLDDMPIRGRKRGTRIPVNLRGQPPKLEFAVDDETRKLTLLTRRPQLAFTYPYLSRGTVDLTYDPELGFSGLGKLTPSLPLLSSTTLAVELEPDSLRVRLETPAEKMKSPIPGFRFTRAELTALLLPEFKPEGVLAFEVGPQGRPIATGNMNVTADEGGLVLSGTLEAHLPRVDQARGEIMYRHGEWTGGITIASTQIRIPGIQSGQLNVGFTKKGVSVDGEAIAAIPGGNVVTFRAQRTKAGDYLYAGDATLRVPGLQPVNAHIQYDGRTFHGKASTGVNLGPLSGKVNLEYVADGDKGTSDLSGKGSLTIKKGRVNGTFTGKVAKGVLTGEGHVQVKLTDKLVGQVGITLDERQHLRVSGGLVVSDPVQLFPRVPEGGGHKELFHRSLDIPIVGITLGPLGAIGLIARISVGFGVNYHFGPGTLDKIQLKVAFNPLENDMALTADGRAELYIPAYAGAYLRLRGALGLSAAIASLTGGIEASAELGLQGGARSAVDFHYEKGGFSIEGVTRISAHPVFRLGLIANVIAEVGALEWRKDWKLANFEVGSGWELGLEAKIGYSSNTGVKLPALSEIRWIYPQHIDPTAILRALFKRGMG